MRYLVAWLIDWPARVAHHIAWFGPLLARITVGWVFAVTGWGKLHNLPKIVENFAGWGIPAPEILAPFVSGVELVGGVLLLLGLYTRIAAAPLAITMIVAIKSVLWPDVGSLADLLGLSEFAYLAIFVWLGTAGPGKVSLDHLLQRWSGTTEY
ncbi:MAG: DoxX family protein [Betaproteobacteria bacterium]